MNNSNYFNNEMINNIRLGLAGYLDNSDSKKLQNFTNYLQTGGSCPCSKVLNSFRKGNIDLALYIINEKKCCYMCSDNDGKTILHHLVNYHFNEDCHSSLLDIINANNASDYINMQNYKGQTPMLLAVLNENQDVALEFENAGAKKDIRDNEGNFIGSNEDESDANNNYIKNVVNIYLPNKSIESLNSDDFVRNIQNEVTNMFDKNMESFIEESDIKSDVPESTLNTDNFIKLLTDRNKQIEQMKNEEKSSFSSDIVSDNDNMKNIQDSDLFFKIIKEKYKDNHVKDQLESDSGSVESSVINLPDSEVNRFVNEVTSDSNNSKFFTQKTNPVKVGLFGASNDGNVLSDTSLINLSDNSINSELLKKQISKLNLSSKFNNLQGGGSKHSHGNPFFRNLNSDSDSVSFNNNSQYMSDFEYGSDNDTNEISRMLNNKKSQLHQEVIDSIIDMLSNGVITYKSKKIEPTEDNARLVKAYIYKKVGEENPQMTGMDKILLIKGMSEDEFVNVTKSMPALDSIQKEITKHMEKKQKDKIKGDSDSSLVSDMSTDDSDASKGSKGSKGKKESKESKGKKESKESKGKKENKESKESKDSKTSSKKSTIKKTATKKTTKSKK